MKKAGAAESFLRAAWEGIAHLQSQDRALAELARPIAEQARPLLSASRSLLLSITVVHADDQAITMCWNGDIHPVPLEQALEKDSSVLQRSRRLIEAAGRDVLTELSLRWPVNAAPPAMGIVTDGGGVVFSSHHPSPLSPNWLAMHQAGLCAPMILLDFSPEGAWARLTEPMSNTIRH
ncbi:hypothetical protein [Sphingomonas sp. 37zxx]|uniref:hypothetical protein n=1 Tax=Sphingomonas sp. 37zxx TaxID=1550073 RepID=UPI00053BE936|nr:hypothetical protein [Sphingomonas sp. 37zxx]